jgi:DNA-binding beta-propeller fold protein YncE
MSTFTFSRYSACLTVIVALDACTMGGSLRAPAPGPLLPPGRAAKSFFSPEAKAKALIFVVISRSNAVDIFSAKHEHKMVGRITGLKDPGRIAVDTSGYLYVANSRATSVPVYAPPYTKGPKLTLSTPGYHPYAVAVSPNGVVAVLMTCATSCPV